MCESNCWYEEGLHFSCTGCGKCCSGAPGYVWVTPEEMTAIASHLSMPFELFVRRYIRQVADRFALTEIKKQNYDCVFLQNCKCIIYEVRPRQCRTFPWWKENLVSEKIWEETAASCEGISPNGRLTSFETIQKQLDGSV
jgi:hypothetical protein